MPELADFERMFTTAEDAAQNGEHQWAEECKDFYDGYQWTAEELAELESRSQMPVVYNRVKRKIDYLIGFERQIRTDARALSRVPNADGSDVEAITDSVRFVLDNNRFDSLRSDAFEDLLIQASMGFEVTVRGKGNDKEIVINRIPYDRRFADPHSREKDYSDANYLGVVVWMDLKFAQAMYPHASDDFEAMVSGGWSSTYSDIPKERYVDTNRKRVRIFTMYYKVPEKNRRGYEWYYVEFTGGKVLKKEGKSAFLNDKGETACAYEYQCAFVDRDGRRYSLTKEMLSAQREINARRSRALHLASARQTISEDGAVEDTDESRRQMTRADGHITVQPGFWGKFDTIPVQDQITRQLELLQEAKAEIDDVGPNAFLAGTDTAIDASGRALQQRKQSQLTGLGSLIDALRQCQNRVYEQVWYRIRQYWTSERWVRVTDDERNAKYAMLNKTVRTMLKEQGREFAFNQDGTIAPINSANDPRLNKKVGADVSKMTVDFVIDDVPDMASIQQEEFMILAELAKLRPQEVPFEDIVELSGLRSDRKAKYLKRKNGEEMSPEEQQRRQMVAQQMQLEQAKTAADLQNKQADTRKKLAEASAKEVDSLESLQQIHRTAPIPVRG